MTDKLCGKGLHEPSKTGRATDGSCLLCKRARQLRWIATPKGQDARNRYEGSAKGVLRRVRDNARRRQGGR